MEIQTLKRYQHWFSGSVDGVTISQETGEDALRADPLDSRRGALNELEKWFVNADETGAKFIGNVFWQYMGTVCIVDGTLSIENWSEIMNDRKEYSRSYHREQRGRTYGYHTGGL